MSLTPIDAQAAQALLEQGAVLIDIRPADEYARKRIAAARHVPLQQLEREALAIEAPTVIFHCLSGNRTRFSASTLAACTAGEAYVLEGGLAAWEKAGLPVVRDRSQPLELQRQVQIAAGTLVVLGVLLGIAVSPWFLALAGFVGAGLVFAGISGFCGLARVLMKMPWNRRANAL